MRYRVLQVAVLVEVGEEATASEVAEAVSNLEADIDVGGWEARLTVIKVQHAVLTVGGMG